MKVEEMFCLLFLGFLSTIRTSRAIRGYKKGLDKR